MGMGSPSYIRAMEKGALDQAIRRSEALLTACRLCPRRCGVDRTRGETGFCGIGEGVILSSYGPHFGEEPCLVGEGGSGALFFAGCNLGCLFCQNWEISHGMEGHEVDDKALAAVMLSLQQMGCENINLVTPTHVVPQILRGLRIAAEAGLHLPLVWNSGGYEATETLGLLEGIVDVYMPDFKWMDARKGQRLTGVDDYPERACEALMEMQRQVGDLEMDGRGVAVSGLLVRHLVMPGEFSDVEGVVRFLAEHVSPRCAVNIMGQYHPCGKAFEVPGLEKRISTETYHRAVALARRAGLRLVG